MLFRKELYLNSLKFCKFKNAQASSLLIRNTPNTIKLKSEYDIILLYPTIRYTAVSGRGESHLKRFKGDDHHFVKLYFLFILFTMLKERISNGQMKFETQS